MDPVLDKFYCTCFCVCVMFSCSMPWHVMTVLLPEHIVQVVSDFIKRWWHTFKLLILSI